MFHAFGRNCVNDGVMRKFCQELTFFFNMEVLDKGSQGFKSIATDNRNEVTKWREKTVG